MARIQKEDITEESISRNRIYKRLEEGKVLVFRRSYLDCLPWWALFVLTIVVIVIINLSLPLAREGVPSEIFLPLVVLAVIVHKKYNVRYALSNRGIGIKIGLISIKLHELQISYNKMRAVEVKRDLFQRIFDLGDLGISTVMIDNPEVMVVGVRRPAEIAAVMEYFIAQETITHETGGDNADASDGGE